MASGPARLETQPPPNIMNEAHSIRQAGVWGWEWGTCEKVSSLHQMWGLIEWEVRGTVQGSACL